MNNTRKLLPLLAISILPVVSGCDSDDGGGGDPTPPPVLRTLTVAVSGNGTVGSQPTGIASCTSTNGTCSASFNDGQVVTLFATPSANSTFRAWAGACTLVAGNPSQCTVTLTANQTVLAVFDAAVAGGIGDTFVLTQSGKLLSFNRATPGTVLSNAAITNGLASGDQLVAISYRPSNGVLYGLAKTTDSTVGHLYLLNESTANATQVAVISGNGFEMVGPEFGMHFDAGTVFDTDKDRLRIADQNGKIYDVNPGTGAVNGADKALAAAVTGLAGTNAFVGSGKKSLYAIAGTSLSTLTLPNTLVTVGGLGTTLPVANGFDIDAVNGVAYVALTGASGPELRTLNLATGVLGAAQSIGDAAIDAETIRGLALPAPAEPQLFGICAGVNDENFHPNPCTVGRTLIRFNASSPGSYSSLAALSGDIGADENIVALDVKPSTNELYALSDASKLYTINPFTSVTTLVSTLDVNLFADADHIYGFDFDPATENLRIIGGISGSDPDTNLVVTTATGVTQTLAAPQQKPFVITSVAFNNNNFGGNATIWYGVDSANDRLFSIDRNTNPDDDPLTNPGRITFVGDLAFNASGISGFEILSAGQPPANNVAYVTRADGVNSYLNQVILTNATSTAVGAAIGSLSGVSGQVVGLTATVNAGANTEMFVATTAAAPDAELWGFDGGDPSSGVDPIPETLTTRRDITGLTAGETVLALDFRFANNVNTLFLLTRGAGNKARLYTVNTGTGVASAVPPIALPPAVAGDITVNGAPYILEGVNYGMDVDPTNNNIRIVSDVFENLSVNPLTATASVIADLNQTPLPAINALAFTNNFMGSTSSELLLLDTNTSGDRVARLDASQILSRSVASGVDNGGGDEASWDILGGHNGVSVVTEATCPEEDLICLNTVGYSVLYFLNVSSDTAVVFPNAGTIGRDTRDANGEDTRIKVRALTARFPD